MAAERIQLKGDLDLQILQGRLDRDLAAFKRKLEKAVKESATVGIGQVDPSLFLKKIKEATTLSLTSPQSRVLTGLGQGGKFSDLSKRDKATASRGLETLRLQAEAQRELLTFARREGFKKEATAISQSLRRTSAQVSELNKLIDPLKRETAEQVRLAKLNTLIRKKNNDTLRAVLKNNELQAKERVRQEKARTPLRAARAEAAGVLGEFGRKSTIGIAPDSVQSLRQVGPLLSLAKAEAKALRDRVASLSKAFGENAKQVKLAERAYQSQRQTVADLTARQKALEEASKAQARATRSAARGVGPVRDLGKAHEELNKPLGQGTLLLRQFFRFAVGYAALFRVLGVIRDLVKGVVELDKELISLQAITRANSDEMDTIESSIKRVATTTKFSTGEIVKAARVLGQAGVEIANIPSALAATADFAAATDSSLETAADLVTTYRNVFKELSDTKIADQLTKAINISKLTADDLKSILSLSSQIAQSYNLTSEQYLAAVTTLRNAGIKASTVATGIRQALSEIFAPNDATIKKLRDRYRQIGEFISSDALKQKFFNFSRADNPLLAALRELDRLGFTGEGQKSLGRVFNVRATNAISALVKNMKSLAEAEAKLTFGRASAEAAEIQMRSLSNSVDNLFAAMTVFSDQVGGPAVRALEGLADGATNAVLELNKLDQQLRSTGKEGLAGSLLPALLGGTAGVLATKGIKGKLLGGAIGTFAGGAAGISGQEEGFGGGDLATLAALAGIGGLLGSKVKGAGSKALEGGPKISGKGLFGERSLGAAGGLKLVTQRGISRLAAFIPVLGPLLGTFLILFDIADLLLDIDLPGSAVAEAARKADAARELLEESQQELSSIQSFVDEFNLADENPQAGTAADQFNKLRKQFADLATKDTPLLREELDSRLRGIASELSRKITQASDAVSKALDDEVDFNDKASLTAQQAKDFSLATLRSRIPELGDILSGSSDLSEETRFKVLEQAVQTLSDAFVEDQKVIQEAVTKNRAKAIKASIDQALVKGAKGNLPLLLNSLDNYYTEVSDASAEGLEALIKGLDEAIVEAKQEAVNSIKARQRNAFIGRPGSFSKAAALELGEQDAKDVEAAKVQANALKVKKDDTERRLAALRESQAKLVEDTRESNLAAIESTLELIKNDPQFAALVKDSGGNSTAGAINSLFSSEEGLAKLREAANNVVFLGKDAITASIDGITTPLSAIAKFTKDYQAKVAGEAETAAELAEFEKFLITAEDEANIQELKDEIESFKREGKVDELINGALESQDNLFTQLRDALVARQENLLGEANRKFLEEFPKGKREIDSAESRKRYEALRKEVLRAERGLAQIPLDMKAQVDAIASGAQDSADAQARRLADLKKTSAELLIEEASSQGDIRKFSEGMSLLAQSSLDAIAALEAQLGRSAALDKTIEEEIAARRANTSALGISAAQIANELEGFISANLSRIQKSIDRPLSTGNVGDDADFNRVGAFTRTTQALKLAESANFLQEQADVMAKGLAESEARLQQLIAADPKADTSALKESIKTQKNNLKDLNVAQVENFNSLRNLTNGLDEATRRTINLDTLLARFEATAITFDDLGDVIQGHFVDALDAVGESLAQAALSGDSLTDTFNDLIGAVAKEIFTDTVKGFVNEGIAKILEVLGAGAPGSPEQTMESAAQTFKQAVDAFAAANGSPPTGGGTTPPASKGEGTGEKAEPGFFGTIFGKFKEAVGTFGTKITDFLGGINLFGFSVGDLVSGIGSMIGKLLGGLGGSGGSGLLASIGKSIFGAANGGLLTQAKKFGSGGLISGAGSTTSDSIPGVVINSDGTKSPVLLSDKEAVLNAKAVEVLGKDFIHAINSGQLGRFNQGGLTASAARMTSSAKPSTANRGMDAALVNQLVGAIEKVKLNANITNLLDKREVAKSALSTTEGERGVLNIIRNNRQSIKQDLS